MIATARTVFRPLIRLGLIPQILIGIVAGVALALFAPNIASDVALLGQLFIAALQAVAIGFMISVVQDSTETALNSSTDVLFTAAACQSQEAKNS